jgi:hypothetical protein
VGLLDSGPEDPKAKLRRYTVTAIAFVILLGLGTWWFLFDFYHITERHVAENFFHTVVAGDMRRAFDLWHGKPGAANSPGYSFEDFVSDWGAKGYYGPVKSFRIESASSPRRGGSGVVVVVDVSPAQPFPSADDPQAARSKVVRIWVESKNHALSFPP